MDFTPGKYKMRNGQIATIERIDDQTKEIGGDLTMTGFVEKSLHKEYWYYNGKYHLIDSHEYDLIEYVAESVITDQSIESSSPPIKAFIKTSGSAFDSDGGGSTAELTSGPGLQADPYVITIWRHELASKAMVALIKRDSSIAPAEVAYRAYCYAQSMIERGKTYGE